MDTHTASKGILRGCLTWPDLAGASKECCLARGANLALSGGQGKTHPYKSQVAQIKLPNKHACSLSLLGKATG